MQWKYIGIYLVLAGSLLCSRLTAEAKSDYEIINTGIKGGGCWLDDSHFVVQKNVPRQGSPGFDLEGLYILDPRHPGALKPISLASLEPRAKTRVWQVTCQDGNITFLVPGSKKGSSRLYRLRIGEEPELIEDMRAPRVSLQGRYVLGNSHRAVMDGGPLQGVFEGSDDCLLADAKAGFKVLCWDSWLERHWLLSKFVLSEYRWEKAIRVRGEDGKAKFAPNPRKPLSGKDGKSLTHTIFLRDLLGQIVANLGEDPVYTIVAARGVAIAPNETDLYAACRKKSQQFDDAPYICRYPLDGKEHHWEEVLAFNQGGKFKNSISDISVDFDGSLYFFVAGARHPYSGIWKFHVMAKQLEHVTTPAAYLNDEAPKASQDGKSVAFSRSGTLFIAQSKGVKQ
ncbi:MAG: hypothetical protein NDI90_19275 [Nitrospira sp. BO4]|jgi:hypothetical protein|nr:hypothetical protein [Nitrospira sp. BO4]